MLSIVPVTFTIPLAPSRLATEEVAKRPPRLSVAPLARSDPVLDQFVLLMEIVAESLAWTVPELVKTSVSMVS